MFFFVGDSTGFTRVFHEFYVCFPRVLPVVIEIEPLWGSGIICFIFYGFSACIPRVLPACFPRVLPVVIDVEPRWGSGIICLVFHGFYPWLLMLNPVGVRELFALYS